MHRLAIYDMDKTIVRRASFGPFLLHVLKQRPWRAVLLPLMLLSALGYAAKLIDRGRLKEINLRLLLGRHFDQAETRAIAKDFAAKFVASDMLCGARRQITADRAAGYRIILATASCRMYVSEIAALIGVDDIIATELRTDLAGRILPLIDGENCYAGAKLMMIKAWLSVQDIKRDEADLRFYSDHVSDEPCLSYADQAFATNPHPPLRLLAQSRGWVIFDWLSEC